MAKGLKRSLKSGPNKEIQSVALGSPAAISATAVLAAVTLGAAAQDVTAGITNPAVTRNLTAKGNAAGIAGNVIITGTDARGATLTETIALNGSTEVAGLKAFATVTNVNLPAKTNGSGDTVSIGFGNKLGLGRVLAYNTVLFAFLNGVREGTAPTVAANAALANNTITLASTLDGNAVLIDLYE